MANVGIGSLQLPMLTKLNYDNWSIKIKVLLGAQEVWEIVENGFQEAEARANQAQRDALKETRKKDKKTLYILYQSVDEDTFETIANAETSKVAWDKLQSTHRGADRVKNNGEEITDVRVMEKVLQSLNTKFEIIVTTIEETQDLENMTIEQFIGSLQAYEEKKKRRMEQTETVEQLLQLKIKEKNSYGCGKGRGDRGHGGRGESNTDVSQNSSESSRGRGGRGHGRRGGRSGRDKSQVKCYNCNKYGHYVNECYSSQTESIDRKYQDRSTASTSKTHQGQSNYAEEDGTLLWFQREKKRVNIICGILTQGPESHVWKTRDVCGVEQDGER
ncbi:uncharacterized protein LOC120073442 [Benincasa hispida]|uniref:uncharacterized protein LOC120073442 n=1 Tax=Benincasa hispida TaxID=102211 RepID=UPI001900C1CF|nr:uncharacterized protein LOC120073442 [Benincasa hispida]